MLKVKKTDLFTLHSDGKAWKTIWGAGHAVDHTRHTQTVGEIADDLARAGRHDPSLAVWPRG